MPDNQMLTPLKPKTKPFKYAVFDIESSNWVNFELLGFYDGKEYLEFDSVKKFLEHILVKRYAFTRFFAHAGGRFDFNFILDALNKHFKDYEYQILSGQGISEIRIFSEESKRAWIFKDSYRLLPMSLRKLTEIFNVEHKKQEIDYANITKDWEKLREYLKYDVVGLYEVIGKFKEWFHKYQVPLQTTLASQSMAMFRTQLKQSIPVLPDKVEAFIRKGYFGGRVEIFKMRAFKHIYGMDVNCFDEQTEIFTENGWKKWNELSTGMKVMSFNSDTEELQFKTIRYIHLYDYDGEMVRFENQNVDLLVTPNHRIIYQEFNRLKGRPEYLTWSKFKVQEASMMPEQFRIPVSGKYTGGIEVFSDDFVKLVGWIVGEGFFHKDSNAIDIYQSDKYPEYLDEIRGILKNLNINFTESECKQTNFRNFCFRILSDDGRELRSLLVPAISKFQQIPDYMMKTLGKRQLKLLYEILIAGEGSRSLGKTSFVSSSDMLLDQFQEICFKTGLKCSINYKWHAAYAKENKNGYFAMVSKFNGDIPQIRDENYKGKVWCVTVGNSFVLVRRNGKVCIAGQSLYPHVMVKYPMPVGKPIYTSSYKTEEIGFYKADIKIPDVYVPPMPIIDKHKLLFPYGKLTGFFSSKELEILQDLGGDINVYYGYIFSGDYIFSDYVRDMYERKRTAKDPMEKLIYKLLLNSVYGKFGQSRIKDKLIRVKNLSDAAGLKPYDPAYNLFTESTLSRATFIIPSISSWVTSCARYELYQWMKKVGDEHLFYVDTDAVFSDKPLSTGDALGEMKMEYEGDEAIFLLPKLYAIRMADGTMKIKAKGFEQAFVKSHLSFKSFERALHGNTLDFKQTVRKFASFKESMKRNSTAISMINQSKSIQSTYDKRKILRNLDTEAWKFPRASLK